jgi:glycosyltransferase involved in cell wall biosynthesis
MGIAARITVTGFQPPPGVARCIQAADVFAMASHHEGFSTSMLEALACGKPIVSTAVSSASTIVDDGQTGYVVPSRDASVFRDALRKALALDSAQVRDSCDDRVPAYALANVRRDLCRVWPVVNAV